MESQVIIDPQTFSQLNDLMGVDFVKEVIDTYNTETGELIERLRQALASQDAATFGSVGALDQIQQRQPGSPGIFSEGA